MTDKTKTKALHVSDKEFADTLKKNSMVVVDCYADWCAPCRMVAPVIEELAGEYEGKVTFAKVDVDSSPGVAMQFGVRSIPTLLFFKDGKLVDQQVGALPKPALKQRVEALLTA
ncbi:thioredoxin [bacterium]|nr:thioredoxin [bacterium]MBU1984658.1 thioredoxin [bacterium]